MRTLNSLRLLAWIPAFAGMTSFHRGIDFF